MTTEARQRLESELARIEYRERHARAILRVLAIVGIASLLMAALVSCSPLRYERTEGTVQYFRTDEERKAAIPAARNRDAAGRYTLPVCPRCGAHPLDQWTGYHCLKGHVYETPNMKLKP